MAPTRYWKNNFQIPYKIDGEDRWVWEGDSSGIYSVRSGYKWLRSQEISGEKDFYSKLWSGWAPLKVKAFCWKLAQNRIPTMQNLAARNIHTQSILCKGCGKEEESASHLYFRCEVFSKVWLECLKWWGLQAPLQEVHNFHLNQFSGLISGSKQQTCMWDLVWFAAIWVIWCAHNAIVLNGKEVVLGELVEQIKLKSWLWITAKNPKCKYPFSCWFSTPMGCLGYVGEYLTN